MEQSFTVTLCGASRVGKSTLINAIIGREVAVTSSSLNACTTSITEHILEQQRNSNDSRLNYTIKFWDTPGIESWTEQHVQQYFYQLIQKTNPICIIYCISPSSFADMNQVKWVLQQCIQRNIFIALVCTNMYSGNRRSTVMEQCIHLLMNINPFFQRFKDGNIEYFGRNDLLTMVNSKAYIDEDQNIWKESSGIDELIFAVAQNQKFWQRKGPYVKNVLQISYTTLSDIANRACAVARYFLPIFSPPTNVIIENERTSTSNSYRKI
ncbi:hypothetical protein I4U23_005789 [Adineta vaga]|nr:hypothetical protein I4U23_005789 [Adineta vaga]